MRQIFLLPFLFLIFITTSFASSYKIKTVPWEKLSNRKLTDSGIAARKTQGDAWQHAETEHFIYHFTQPTPAQTVVIHAEGYYEWVRQTLKAPSETQFQKSHIFIFDDREIWNDFVLTTPEKLPGGEAFTNGIELFMYRDPFWMEAPRVLAHEITHLAAARFVEGKLPLFLNEGFAEFMATRAVAMKTDGDTFRVKNFQPIQEKDYIPLSKLASFESYPESVDIFYRQSEYLIRYLIQQGDSKLYDFLKKSAAGKSLGAALQDVYGLTVQSLDEKLKMYCLTR